VIAKNRLGSTFGPVLGQMETRREFQQKAKYILGFSTICKIETIAFNNAVGDYHRRRSIDEAA
jgi:hypothetical protein